MTSQTVLLIDDEEDVRLAQGQALELEGVNVTAFARAERVLDRIEAGFDGVIVSDIRMPRMDGLALLDAVREIDETLPVILMTGHGDVPLAVEAMRRGAYDFLEKPFAAARLVSAVTRALEYRRLSLENRFIRAELDDRSALDSLLIGRTTEMRALGQTLRKIASSEIDVLIRGETGTGKALVARAIHDLSERSEKPFVTVSLAALPEATLDSELFGHEAGAFLGAQRARYGRFEHARGGTIFLDEIGAASPAVQAKLLKVIEDRAIERVGSQEKIPLDVRFVASTNQLLEDEEGLRRDLLYRLAAVTVTVPPLRERIDDLPALFQHLVNRAAHRLNEKDQPEIDVPLLQVLAAHDWPGNIRELRNVAERFVLGLDLGFGTPAPVGETLAEQVERFERALIAATLAANGGELKTTYESLGLSRKTLYEKMQRHSLKREDFAAAKE